MGKAAVVIRVVNDKVDLKMPLENANISELSQLYSFLGIARSDVLNLIKQMVSKEMAENNNKNNNDK